MRVRGSELEPIDPPEFADLVERLRGERRLALQRVEGQALDQFPETHIPELGYGLQDLHEALFKSNSGLDPVHRYLGARWYHGTNVHKTQSGRKVRP